MPKQEVILGLVRHALTAAGGALVTLGVLDEATSQQAIGAGMTLLGIVLSVVAKRGA